MMSITFFENIYDTEVKRIDVEDWDHLVSLLKKLSTMKAVKGGPKSAPLISSAKYIKGSTRANKNVLCWNGWCAVDVDDYITIEDDLQKSLNTICGQYEYLCYSTASSTVIQPKFRLVFPLTRDVERDEIPHFWYALNKEISGIGDAQTKDVSRMFYVPGIYPNAHNFIFKNDGEFVNPDKLMKKWEYVKPSGNSFLDRLPPELREQVVQYRKDQMTNRDVTWSSYHDCPFFPKKLAREYKSISGTGWYHKMYQIMVATAANAINNNYPITAAEIAKMCEQLDAETGNWYENRPLKREADGAIEYVYRN